VRAFRDHPHWLIAALAEDTQALGEEIARARELLPQVDLVPEAASLTLHMVQELEISSHRAEITVLEAARARAAADDRRMATVEDVAAVAPMALRQRRSEFIRQYFEAARTEETQIATVRRKAMKSSDS
jgi:magnesium chelatase subunit I